MSTLGNVPPQAYTRDVLVRAFEWLNTQPPAIRERAGNADALVGMYLQAKRRLVGDGSRSDFEVPTAASVEAFKADLRTLAEGLKQFDGPQAPPHNPPAPAVTSPPPRVTVTAERPASQPILDERSRKYAAEVRERMNLGSEQEAVRALIAFGYEHLRDLLPRT